VQHACTGCRHLTLCVIAVFVIVFSFTYFIFLACCRLAVFRYAKCVDPVYQFCKKCKRCTVASVAAVATGFLLVSFCGY
jgi:O-antigen ligase